VRFGARHFSIYAQCCNERRKNWFHISSILFFPISLFFLLTAKKRQKNVSPFHVYVFSVAYVISYQQYDNVVGIFMSVEEENLTANSQ
jgi:hypothetical protein